MNPPRNLAASVRQRLLDLSRQQREEFQGLLTRYALERLLYRLGQSSYRDTFILKGASSTYPARVLLAHRNFLVRF